MIWIKRGKKLVSEVQQESSSKLKPVILATLVTLAATSGTSVEATKSTVLKQDRKQVIVRHKKQNRPHHHEQESPSPSRSPQNSSSPSPSLPTKIIVIPHDSLLSALSNPKVKDVNIKYGSDGFVFSGRYDVGPISVRYNVDANFRKTESDLGIKISKLFIEGKEESGKRVQDIENKLQKLFKVSNDKEFKYRVNVMDGKGKVYDQLL